VVNVSRVDHLHSIMSVHRLWQSQGQSSLKQRQCSFFLHAALNWLGMRVAPIFLADDAATSKACQSARIGFT
jgi:hypothetical protein